MMGQPTSQLASTCNLIVSLATELWQSTEEVQMASVNLRLLNQFCEDLWEGTISCILKCMFLKDVYFCNCTHNPTWMWVVYKVQSDAEWSLQTAPSEDYMYEVVFMGFLIQQNYSITERVGAPN